MITNLISFLYNIKVDYIRKNKDSYIFFLNNVFYIFKKSLISEENINYINNFIDERSLFHLLIKNRYNKYLSSFNSEYYVLMKVKFKVNRLLMLEDIYSLSGYNLFYVKKSDFSWTRLWKNKIDQIEYYINNVNYINIYSLAIINYYIGLSELAINYFNDNVKSNIFPLTLCHKRIRCNFDLYDYYSITDIVFDHNIRDLAEYIKCDIYQSKAIDLNKYKVIKKTIDKDLLISRILFPSYFFDIIDDFIVNNRDFKDFADYFINIGIYETNLLKFIDFMTK